MPEYVYRSSDGEERVLHQRMSDDHPDAFDVAGKVYRRVWNNVRIDDRASAANGYPYASMKLAGTPAADDCPKTTVSMGKKHRGQVEVPIVKSKRHEQNLMAKHNLTRI